jgi:hypothetical protein
MSRFPLCILVLSLAAAACGRTAAPVTSASSNTIVEQKSPTSAELRAALVARRQHNLAVLRAYREAGQFPRNFTVEGDGHFLIDGRGVLCAVANLIAMDGHRDRIVSASAENNGLLFAEVKSGFFHDWILTSGFTSEEISRIQAPAPPISEHDLIVDPDAAVLAADAVVRDYLIAVEAELGQGAGIELALARLDGRADLIAELMSPTPTVASLRFAQPPGA